ncbi:MAG: hypothetical protein AABY00_01620 [Nanoarchaeota archaeon]
MENTIKTINQRITNTDIFIFNYNPQTSLYTYSRPFTIEEATSLAVETNNIITSRYKDAKGLKGGITVNSDTAELTNMSTLKGIVANRVLMNTAQKTENLKRFPTIEEGIELQKQGMLNTGVLIDFGLVLYSNTNPDQEIAGSLVTQAQEQNYALPVLASFTALDLQLGGKRYGVTPTFISSQGLLSGVEAQTFLEKHGFYQGKSGVLGLGRGRDGDWHAGWGGGFVSSDGDCRVGRVSAEGSAKKLEEEASGAFVPIRKSLDTILSAYN